MVGPRLQPLVNPLLYQGKMKLFLPTLKLLLLPLPLGPVLPHRVRHHTFIRPFGPLQTPSHFLP